MLHSQKTIIISKKDNNKKNCLGMCVCALSAIEMGDQKTIIHEKKNK